MENVTDPKTAFSEELNTAPVQRAFNTDIPFYEIIEKPENAFRFRRFGLAMIATSTAQPPAAILQGWHVQIMCCDLKLIPSPGFDWDSVPQGGLVVDVGGGIGNISLEIARARPDLQIVVEDRPQVIEKAKEVSCHVMIHVYTL